MPEEITQISKLLDEFIKHLKVEKNLSGNSLSSYRLDIEDFIKFIIAHNLDFFSLTNQNINKYFETMYAKLLAIKTHQRRLSSLKSFFAFLQSEGKISANPFKDIERPKDQVVIPSFLSQEDINTMMQKAAEDKTPNGIRFYCILAMLYCTGMRISECLELPLSLFTPKIRTEIIITGKGSKERIIFLNAPTIKILERFLMLRHTFFIGNEQNLHKNKYLFAAKNLTHLTRQTFFTSLKQLATKCNIEAEKVSPHKLRHSFATHLYQQGTDIRIIQEMLGHASITNTQIYTHTNPTELIEAVKKLHPLSKKKIDM